MCGKEKHAKWFFVTSHLSGARHCKLKVNPPTATQQFLPTASGTDFAKEVVRVFLPAYIPLKKLRNPDLRNFFSKMGHPLPSESSAREKLKTLAVEETAWVKGILSEKQIFAVVDESDIRGAKFLVILARLIDVPDKTYMVDCIPLTESLNAQKIVQAIDDTLKEMQISRANFCLLLSDAAPYMISAARTLKVVCPQMLHVTCLAHLIHNAAMKVKMYFDKVDELIACVKAATVKNKSRRALFDGIGIPPEPVVTRWGSWLQAAFFHGKRLPVIREIVGDFKGEGVLVRRAKEAVLDEGHATSLIQIERCYKGLAELALELDPSDCTIERAFKKINSLDIGRDPCPIENYLEKRLKKNDIELIMTAERPDIARATYAKLLNCQPTSASVELSFSMLNKMLVKDRNFNPQNVRNHITLHYNSCC